MYLNSFPSPGYKRRMIYSALPIEPWNFAPLIAKPYSSRKARSSDQIAGRDGQFVPFLVLFWASKKVQEMSR
ncbi:hypothetical protein COR50_00080 [Chitinophaga caeni]|uniref:Uncharacterized protein n=1 Tax=Chitinophaga caeni TaxID=2029983 RepID=A0A291QP49_9BACT|nr:hypothetical protein COR50_00080 [Chitinophaga caeni]